MMAREALQDSLGIYLVVILCVAVPKAVFSLFSLLLRGAGKLFRLHMPYGWISLLPTLGVLGYLLFGAIFR